MCIDPEEPDHSHRSPRRGRTSDRPIVRSEALRDGVLVSVRGGDYELTVGKDL